jgi:hypothetical protein
MSHFFNGPRGCPVPTPTHSQPLRGSAFDDEIAAEYYSKARYMGDLSVQCKAVQRIGCSNHSSFETYNKNREKLGLGRKTICCAWIPTARHLLPLQLA